MASDARKAETEALQMENLFKAKGAAAQQAETDAFVCGRCKQRKCMYYQMQVRAPFPLPAFWVFNGLHRLSKRARGGADH